MNMRWKNCVAENAIFSPHILTTWEEPFRGSLYSFSRQPFYSAAPNGGGVSSFSPQVMIQIV